MSYPLGGGDKLLELISIFSLRAGRQPPQALVDTDVAMRAKIVWSPCGGVAIAAVPSKLNSTASQFHL